jgi:2-amino-4-hydroxy-6-hydroxymethyldihydropteridine diphosphokinase
LARAYVGLGSNVGDRRSNLTVALNGLSNLGKVVGGSPIYETDPVGNTNQDPFENAVVAIETDMSARSLLDGLLAIESSAGRERLERWGPRTLDLDILWFDGEVIDEPGLTVPHPRIRERKFVLAPLVYLAPGLEDAVGSYAKALTNVSEQGVRRVTGPVDVANLRWRIGLFEAMDLMTTDAGYTIYLAHDWVNRNGAIFGGFLGSSMLAVGAREHPDMVPTTMTYRYIKPVPEGGRADVKVVHERESPRSALMSMTIEIDGEEYGAAHLSVVVDRGETRVGRAMPDVLPIEECRPVDELMASIGDEPGNSVESWRPLERWDVPDLADGTSDAFRAWCPNPMEGSDNPYAAAAAAFLPIDALIWPATMTAAGRLSTGPFIFTPTVEITARFADTSNPGGFQLGEAVVDHMSTKSVAGTVRVWSTDGRHIATGHSLNLTIG